MGDEARHDQRGQFFDETLQQENADQLVPRTTEVTFLSSAPLGISP
jgi:hypothetical protein